MNNLERIREKLYKTLEDGHKEDILRISQELDKKILECIALKDKKYPRPF